METSGKHQVPVLGFKHDRPLVNNNLPPRQRQEEYKAAMLQYLQVTLCRHSLWYYDLQGVLATISADTSLGLSIQNTSNVISHLIAAKV
jgi:hypothetical protein